MLFSCADSSGTLDLDSRSAQNGGRHFGNFEQYNRMSVQAIADLRSCREAEWRVNSNGCEKRPNFICANKSPVHEGGWRILLGDNTCRGRSCSSAPESVRAQFTVHSWKFKLTVHSWQCTIDSAQLTVQLTVFGWQCTVDSVQLTVQLTEHSWQCTVDSYSWQCTVDSLQLTVHSWQCTVDSAQLTAYILNWQLNKIRFALDLPDRHCPVSAVRLSCRL